MIFKKRPSGRFLFSEAVCPKQMRRSSSLVAQRRDNLVTIQKAMENYVKRIMLGLNRIIFLNKNHRKENIEQQG